MASPIATDVSFTHSTITKPPVALQTTAKPAAGQWSGTIMPHRSHIHSCIAVLQAVVQTFTLPGLLPAQTTTSGATADNPGPSAHATQRVLDPRSAHRGCERNSDSLTTTPA